VRTPVTLPLLIVGLLVWQGCGRSHDELPIPEERLPAIMIDVYLARARSELEGQSAAEAVSEALRSHGFDTTAYNETLNLLTANPELGKEIFQTVLDSVIMEQRNIRARMMLDSVAANS
jgi:hypothetical protein